MCVYACMHSCVCKPSRIGGEFLQVVVHVEGVGLAEMDQLLQSLVNKNDADQRGKGFFSETRDVANECAGIGSHQQQTEESSPKANACPQRQIGQPVLSEKKKQENKVL